MLGEEIHLLELTICHETNLVKSRDYKLEKYSTVKQDCTKHYFKHKVICHPVEVSTFGHITDFSQFTKLFCNCARLPDKIFSEIVKSVIGNSYNIYRHRNEPIVSTNVVTDFNI